MVMSLMVGLDGMSKNVSVVRFCCGSLAWDLENKSSLCRTVRDILY